jgi:hypothetical protein
MSKKNNLEKKVATIESHVFDQGGFSYCSECRENLTEYLRVTPIEEDYVCSGCNSYLTYGGISIESGGSDF